MAYGTALYYWLTCDEPGCERKSTEGGEHSAWSERWMAYEEADNCDWWLSHFPEKSGRAESHYCAEHAPRCSTCGNVLEEDGECGDADLHEKGKE